jgi:hypothetical protein
LSHFVAKRSDAVNDQFDDIAWLELPVKLKSGTTTHSTRTNHIAWHNSFTKTRPGN